MFRDFLGPGSAKVEIPLTCVSLQHCSNQEEKLSKMCFKSNTKVTVEAGLVGR